MTRNILIPTGVIEVEARTAGGEEVAAIYMIADGTIALEDADADADGDV